MKTAPLIAITPPVQAAVSGQTDVRAAVIPVPLNTAAIKAVITVKLQRPALATAVRAVRPIRTQKLKMATLHAITARVRAGVVMPMDVQAAVIHRQPGIAVIKFAIMEKRHQAVAEIAVDQ